MAEPKKGNADASVFAGENRVGYGSLCSGNAAGKVSAGGFGCISAIFVEVRSEFAGIDYI